MGTGRNSNWHEMGYPMCAYQPDIRASLPKHGADVEISITKHKPSFTTESGKLFHHVDKQGKTTQPSVKSYNDGVRIGCTFVTNEALEKLAELHKNFLTNPGFRIHQ